MAEIIDRVKRRERRAFITLLGGTAAAWPFYFGPSSLYDLKRDEEAGS